MLANRIDDESGITEEAYVEAKASTTRDHLDQLAMTAHDQL